MVPEVRRSIVLVSHQVVAEFLVISFLGSQREELIC